MGMNEHNSSINGLFSNTISVNKLRDLRQSFISCDDYRSASFWADKIVSLSNGDSDDVYQQSYCFYHMKEYHRAAHCIKSRNLHKTSLSCKHLAAKCHFSAKEYKEALEILESDAFDPTLGYSSEERNWRSAIALLRGQIYEASDNRTIAVNCFKEALKWNIYCYEAFHSLIQHQMLTREEEEELLNSLDFDNQCSTEKNSLVKFLYESQLKKYDKPGDLIVPSEYKDFIHNNVDILTSLAERHYYNCEYQQSFKITSEVLRKDLYHSQCLPIHISCLMELKKTNPHKLVDLYPESALSWFSVGCYYLLINKADAARRFLSKATTLDNVFAPAWLLYGHSFAVESEHDQAMAAYFKASHLMRGCHLPLLYIGLEYGLTDNTKLAEKFIDQAQSIAPNDPFVSHELGVISYQNSKYEEAEKHFRDALNIIKNRKEITVLPDKWEPLLNNMGHVLRKMKKFEEAVDYHKQALMLSPQNPSTYSALGFVYSLMTKWNDAVEYFHKALALKRDDAFSTTMLGHAIEHLVNEISPFHDNAAPEELPLYEHPNYINDFMQSKANEEKNLINSNVTTKSSAKLKTNVSNVSLHSGGTEISCDDVEMEISN